MTNALRKRDTSAPTGVNDPPRRPHGDAMVSFDRSTDIEKQAPALCNAPVGPSLGIYRRSSRSRVPLAVAAKQIALSYIMHRRSLWRHRLLSMRGFPRD